MRDARVRGIAACLLCSLLVVGCSESTAVRLEERGLVRGKLAGANAVKADLRMVRLRSEDMRRANMAGAFLGGADLSGSDLREAVLVGANLGAVKVLKRGKCEWVGSNLNRARLQSADLSGAYLVGASLRNATLDRANLSEADLGSTRFRIDGGFTLSGADCTEVSARRAQMRGARLTGVSLAGAVLDGSDLGTADLSGANLRRASLRDCDLRGADLRHVLLDSTIFKGARYDRHTRWPDGFDPAPCGAVSEPRRP